LCKRRGLTQSVQYNKKISSSMMLLTNKLECFSLMRLKG
jgi:hypothetical protein